MSSRKAELELGGLGLALVDERLLYVVSWVELGRLLRYRAGSRRLGVMAGEDASVLGLYSPETTLVVHLGPGVLANAANDIWVAAHPRPSHLRRHWTWTLGLVLFTKKRKRRRKGKKRG